MPQELQPPKKKATIAIRPRCKRLNHSTTWREEKIKFRPRQVMRNRSKFIKFDCFYFFKVEELFSDSHCWAKLRRYKKYLSKLYLVREKNAELLNNLFVLMCFGHSEVLVEIQSFQISSISVPNRCLFKKCIYQILL